MQENLLLYDKLVKMELASNELGNICLYKTCLNGIVTDYILNFSRIVTDLNVIVNEIHDLVEQLFKSFDGARVKARMVAQVSYYHVNENNERGEIRSYHFPSYPAIV